MCQGSFNFLEDFLMADLKDAAPDHPIHELLVRRFSPYAFDSRPVPDDELRSMFEAARWAASSYNEQPWSYIVATADEPEAFERLLSCLITANQVWAKAAPVLALGCTRLVFARNGQPNAVAVHDLGLASANLTFEASARGLYVHQMAGIIPERARELYKIPEDVQPVTALAIGYRADPGSLPESLRARDVGARARKPLSEFVFGEEWGKASGSAR
jgi:nitroreductase